MGKAAVAKRTPASKTIKAQVKDGVVLFIFESVVADLGEPTPSADAIKVIKEAAAYGNADDPIVKKRDAELKKLKDAHLPKSVKDHIKGDDVTGYLFDRKALEEYEAMMNHGKDTDPGHSGSEPVVSAETGGSVSDPEGGPQNGDKVGG
jgi:hypothetical protein